MRPTWDEVWLRIADEMSRRSLCVRAQVGAVIVTSDNRVQAVSYNGPSPRLSRSTPCSAWCPRALGATDTLSPDYADCESSHAEINAIARADATQLDGATIYVNGSVCYSCAKAIAATRVSRVVMRINNTDAHRQPDKVIAYLEQCNIEMKVVNGSGRQQSC